MSRKDEINLRISELESEIEPLQKELNQLFRDEADLIKERITKCHQLKDKFTEDELVYAAYTRCPCGAGMAYPEGIGMHGSWYCSDILLGQANVEDLHTEGMPFMFYEIKSDNQPSANGATTRIKIKKDV